MARYELNLRDYYRIIRRHIIVITAVAVGLGGITYLRSPTESNYRAMATVRITRSSDLTGLLLQTFYWSPEDNIATQTRLISSQPVLLRIAKRMGRVPEHFNIEDALIDSAAADLITKLSRRIVANQVGYSGLIDIIVTAKSPQEAMDLAKHAAMAYEDYSLDSTNSRTIEARRFIERQLNEVSDSLAIAQQKLKDFRKESPYSTADITSLTPLLDRWNSLYDRMLSLEEQKLRLREGSISLPTVGTSLDATALMPYAEAFGELTRLLAERGRLLLTYTEEAERVRVMEERISEVRLELQMTIQQDLNLLKSRLGELDRQLKAYPEEEIRFATLKRSVDLNTQLVTQLESSLQEVRIREAEQIKEVHIVNLPTIAEADQEGGRDLKAVIGLLLGLMLGIVLAFVLETIDTSIGTIEDVEEYLEVPVLAVIPHLSIEKISDRLIELNPQLRDHPDLDKYARLIALHNPRSPAAEAYRTLRTNLQFATAGAGELMETKNTFVFTSSDLQEGKTTTLANLAITTAQAGNRVLLMGCNMRRPTIYKSFGLLLENGMTDILTGIKGWRECVKTATDMLAGQLTIKDFMSVPGLDNLHIITAGGIPPNPSELLNSPRFSELIEEARREFDIILVDCPPILPVTDAAIVSRQVDWSVLVYQVGKIPRNALRRAKFHLTNVGSRVLGIAMNDVKAEISGYSPYSQYMTKYYGEDAKRKKTLWQRLKSFITGKTWAPTDLEDESRPESHRIRGSKGEAPWIEVDYYNDEQQESGPSIRNYNDLPHFTAESDSPEITDSDHTAGDTESEPESGPGVEDKGPLLGRIPLWGWIALFVAILILVFSIIFGSCSENEASAVTGEPSVIRGDTTPPPVTAVELNTSVWSVQVGSFRTTGEAENMIRTLSDIELPEPGLCWSRIEELPGLGSWNRVFVGQYSERIDCERVAEILRESGQIAIALVRSVPPPNP